ncbi:Tubulin_tyrosine ligase [Hexamita inflata]|uniref:Tubulin tyrosine ligase n=1 Tax=Hexamita inflata TaxID=28002 RepID=A0AA86PJR6_9EUKA|nr:Tubulin tyrosine ligase [Hexamita inflata]
MKTYRIDFRNSAVESVLQQRDFIQVFDDTFDVLWTSQFNALKLFANLDSEAHNPSKLINHFPESRQLTITELLNQNLRVYNSKEEGLSIFYYLPKDYDVVMKEMRGPMLARPIGHSSGPQKILSNIEEMKQFKKEQKDKQYIVQGIGQKPYYINNQRVQLFLNVVVPSFSPLVAYRYYDGYCKCGDDTISFSNLLLYLEARTSIKDVQMNINRVILHTLKAVQPAIPYVRQCFEVFEFNFELLQDLKVKLISINADINLSMDSSENVEESVEFAERLMRLLIERDDKKWLVVIDERGGRKWQEYL